MIILNKIETIKTQNSEREKKKRSGKATYKENKVRKLQIKSYKLV